MSGSSATRFVIATMLCLLAAETRGFTDDTAWRSRMMAARAASDAGKLAEANLHLEAALADAGAHDPSDGRVVATLDGLAGLAIRRGRPVEAIGFRRRALDITEKTRGAGHPDVALGLNALAQLHQSQGELAVAEPMFRRALAIYRDALGPGHVHVGTLSNNLAELLAAAGRLGEAGAYYRRAIAIWETALGGDHEYVAAAIGRYAALLRAAGRGAEAAPLEAKIRSMKESARARRPDR